MQYINETREEVASRCQSPRVKEIHKRLERIRSNEEVGVRWMQAWEENLKFKKDGMAEGLRIGREEARKAREEGLQIGREEARKAREEGLRIAQEEARKAREQGIKALLITSFELGAADDIVRNKLMELFNLTEEEAYERISRYRESV